MESTSLVQLSASNTTPRALTADDFWEWRLQVKLWIYISPVLVIAGIFFNTLTIIVLLRRKFGKPSTRILLIVLAVSDTVVLLTGLLRHWLIYTFRIDLRVLTNVSCPLHIFFTYFSRHYSSWSVPLLTVERWISVTYPLKVNVICTRKWTRVVLVAISIILFTLNSHMFVFFKRNESMTCTYSSQAYRNDFWLTVWFWLDFLAYSAMPFIVIVSCNCSIVYQIVARQNRRKELQTSGGEKTDIASAQVMSITYMLTTVSVVFLLLTLPKSVSYIAYRQIRDTSPKWFYQKYLSWAVTNLLGYVNNMINFPLYCACGTQFRREVFALFRDWRRGENSRS
ncbi:FMRFamide receptor-like [Lineus longissimus]|uniref:FMRFamide receptor-like n=1 Tax=Lineus longissimus TaxID=88925 RepID=UPI00315DC968